MDRITTAAAPATLATVLGCTAASPAPPVALADRGPNAVALWGERGAAAINQPSTTTGTPEKRRPACDLDMATLHPAIHRAVRAAPGASHEAAAHAAGHAVLKALHPQRGVSYQAARDERLRIGVARVVLRRLDEGR